MVQNNVTGLGPTINSVLSQNYPAVEYLIIDGGSTDGTQEVIRKYEHRITSWISEPDQGPYDAMNKGLSKATGEWVLFMNAGDRFVDPAVLSRIFSQDLSGIDVIYGDSVADYGKFRVSLKAGPIGELWKGMVFSHQSLIVRTILMRGNGFNLKYPIGADYELVYRLFSGKKRFHYYPEPIAEVEIMGVSHRKMVRSSWEHFNILRACGKPTWCNRLYYYFRWCFLSLITLGYWLFPLSFIFVILKVIYKNRLVRERA